MLVSFSIFSDPLSLMYIYEPTLKRNYMLYVEFVREKVRQSAIIMSRSGGKRVLNFTIKRYMYGNKY